MKHYTFTVPGHPVGKQSYHTRQGIPYIPKKSCDYMNKVKQCAIDAGVTQMKRCLMNIFIVLPVRIKRFKTKPDEIYEPLKRPDKSNVLKGVEDALNKIAYHDDKHILDGFQKFNFRDDIDEPYIVVRLEEIRWDDYYYKNIAGTVIIE